MACSFEKNKWPCSFVSIQPMDKFFQNRTRTWPILRAVDLSYPRLERNHCDQPAAFLSSMREFKNPTNSGVIRSLVLSLLFWAEFYDISFKFFTGSVSVLKNADFLEKALTNKNDPNLTVEVQNCVCLGSDLNIKPKFKAVFPALVRDCWARWTQHSKQQFETIRVLNKIESSFVKALLCEWTSSKLKKGRALETPEEEF